MSMVPEGSLVCKAYLRRAEPGSVAQTIDRLLHTATSLLVNECINEKYPTASFVNVLVSGGLIGVKNATLTVMLGCSDTDPNLPRLQELVSLMSKSIVRVEGPRWD